MYFSKTTLRMKQISRRGEKKLFYHLARRVGMNPNRKTLYFARVSATHGFVYELTKSFLHVAKHGTVRLVSLPVLLSRLSLFFLFLFVFLTSHLHGALRNGSRAVMLIDLLLGVSFALWPDSLEALLLLSFFLSFLFVFESVLFLGFGPFMQELGLFVG